MADGCAFYLPLATRWPPSTPFWGQGREGGGWIEMGCKDSHLSEQVHHGRVHCTYLAPVIRSTSCTSCFGSGSILPPLLFLLLLAAEDPPSSFFPESLHNISQCYSQRNECQEQGGQIFAVFQPKSFQFGF